MGSLMKLAALSAVALLIVGLTVGGLLFTLEVLSPSDLWTPPGAFVAGLTASLLLGAGPALLLGVPAYWLLWRRRRAQWRTILPLGAALGALIVVIEPALLGWGVLAGVGTAVLTHLAARGRLGR